MLAVETLRPGNVFGRLAARLDPGSPHARSARQRDEALSDVRLFARHVTIQDPDGLPIAFRTAGWAWQFALLGLWLVSRLTVVLKARQLGVSWLAAIYALWVAIRRPGQLVLLISQRQEDADKLLAKVTYIWERLPEEWRPVARPHVRSITFPGLGSSIEALPASEGIGRSRTANLVILDEHAHQMYARQIFQAVMPAAERGQVISLSTANGRTALHSGLFINAKARRPLVPAQDADGTPLPMRVTPGPGPNGWWAVFLPFSARPGRDGAWRERSRAEQSDLSDAEFVQEYPRDDVEAIRVSGRVVFSADDLERQPLEQPRRCRVRDLRVYREPAAGRRYVLAADVGEGLETSDWSSAVVMDAETGEQVAQFRERVSTDLFAQRIESIASWYGAAAATKDEPQPVLVAVERNNHGLAVIQELARIRPLDAPWRQVRMAGATGRRRFGWLTTKANRPVLVRQLEVALRTGAITLHDAGTLDQFGMFAYDDDGRPQAMEGAHDDDVMALGIAVQVCARPGAAILDVPPSARRAA